MLFQLDFASDVPIYQQIRNQIVLGIAQGELKAGEKLPTVRALAQESGVNAMTVSKAYQLLKQEGYLQTERRAGAVVTIPGESFSERERAQKPDREMAEKLRLCLAELKLAGLKEEEILKLCREILAGEEGQLWET